MQLKRGAHVGCLLSLRLGIVAAYAGDDVPPIHRGRVSVFLCVR